MSHVSPLRPKRLYRGRAKPASLRTKITTLLSRARLGRFTWILLMCTLWPASSGQALSISGFKNDMVEFLLKQVSVPGEFEIRAGKIEQLEGGGTVLERVEILDSQGTWFTASRFDFSWSPSRLLRGEVQIDHLTLSGGRLERLPIAKTDVTSDKVTPTKPASKSGWPRSPITLRIEQIQISDMQISDQVLPQHLAFDAQGALRDETDLQSLRLDIVRTDTIKGRILVDYAKRFTPDSLRLSVKADEAPAGLVAQLLALPDDTPVSLDLEADGPPQSWGGQLSLSARDMLSAKGRFDAAWAERIKTGIDLDVTAGEKLPKAMRDALGDGASLRVTAQENDAGQVVIETASLQSAALEVATRGHIDRKNRSLDLAVEISSDPKEAARLAELIPSLGFSQVNIEVHVQGPFSDLSIKGIGALIEPQAEGFGARSASLDLAAALRSGRVELNITAKAKQPFGPAAVYAQALGEELSMTLSANRSADAIEIQRLGIDARTLALNVNGVLQTTGKIIPDLHYDVRIDTITPWAHAAGLRAAGSLRGAGQLQPVPNTQQFTATGDIHLSSLRLNDALLDRIDLSHSVNIGDQISGSARVALQSPQFGPGRVATRFLVAKQQVDIRELSARLLGINAGGTISFDSSANATGPVQRADLKLQIDSLQPLGQLLGMSINGAGKGNLKVGSDKGVFDLQLQGLQASTASIGRLALQGTARNISRTPVLNLTLDGADLLAVTASSQPTTKVTDSRSSLEAGSGGKQSQLSFKTLRATVDGPLSALKVQIDTNGRHGEHVIELQSAALADLAAKTRRIVLERMEANYGSERVLLQSPLTVLHGARGTKLSDLNLVIGTDGRLEGAFELSPGAVSIDLQLAQIPLGMAGRLGFAPIQAGRLSGLLRANSSISPKAQTPNSGRMTLELTDLELEGSGKQAGRINANAKGAWDGSELSLQARITSPLQTPIEVDARLPLQADANTIVRVPEQGQLQGAARWQGDLSELIALTPPSDHLFGGEGKLDIRADGPVSKPNLSGTLAIRDGSYENLLAGTILRSLMLDTSFSQAGRIQFKLSATDGGSGAITGAGTFNIGTEDRGLSLDLQAQQAVLVRLDEATVQTSANLKLAGPPDSLRLSGRVELDQAEIRLSNPLPPSIVVLEDVQIKGQPAPAQPTTGNESGLLALDVDVLIPGRVFVRGRGLDSEWGGELKIAGSSATPLITGAVRAKRGTLDFLGRAFKLQRGIISFSGGRRVDPDIDISLERESGGVTGRIVVNGTASAPKLGFESSPALPQDEVMPVVLFGRSRQSLSGLEAVQLAAGIASLTSGEAGVVDRVRASLGVDVLRVESSDKAGEASTVNVGRYVEDGVYVGARQSLDGTRSSVVVEINVLDNVTVDADVGATADTSVGVNWRKDF